MSLLVACMSQCYYLEVYALYMLCWGLGGRNRRGIGLTKSLNLMFKRVWEPCEPQNFTWKLSVLSVMSRNISLGICSFIVLYDVVVNAGPSPNRSIEVDMLSILIVAKQTIRDVFLGWEMSEVVREHHTHLSLESNRFMFSMCFVFNLCSTHLISVFLFLISNLNEWIFLYHRDFQIVGVCLTAITQTGVGAL